MNDRRRGNDGAGIRIELGDPAQISGRGVDGHHVAVQIGDDHQSAHKDRTGARDRSGDPVVARDRPRPQHLTALGVDLPQHAAPVGKENRQASAAPVAAPIQGRRLRVERRLVFVLAAAKRATHGRRCRHVARGRQDPPRSEARDVPPADPGLSRLTARVVDVVADHRPLVPVVRIMRQGRARRRDRDRHRGAQHQGDTSDNAVRRRSRRRQGPVCFEHGSLPPIAE